MHMSGSMITGNLPFSHINKRCMEISIHMSGLIVTEHLTFLHVTGRSMEFLCTCLDQR